MFQQMSNPTTCSGIEVNAAAGYPVPQVTSKAKGTGRSMSTAILAGATANGWEYGPWRTFRPRDNR